MKTRYACWLNGHGLQDLDPAIYITDIAEAAAKVRTQTATKAKGDGTILLRRARQSLTVTIQFAIREYDTARRKAVMEKIVRWADDGWLTINDRPDQQLWVTVDALPTITSALKWADILTIALTAYEMPYWLSQWPPQASTSAATSAKVNLSPAALAAHAYLEAWVTNHGTSPMTKLSISTDDGEITLDGMSLGAGKTAAICYDSRGILTLPVAYRTGDSSDELTLTPGKPNPIVIKADQPVSVLLKAREEFA